MIKKLLKVLGIVVGALLVAVGGFASFIYFDWPVKKPVYPVSVKVTITPERVARGKQIVSMRCAGCHYDQVTGGLTGRRMSDAPLEFGPIFSHNITKHATRGAGRYSDGELLYLLRTGIRRDGVFSGPFMQSPNLGDEDLYSVIAFLRSDDPWVRARDVPDQSWQPTFLAKMLMHVAFKTLSLPKQKIPVPDVHDQVAYGRYVVNGLGDCFSCHSADFKTMNVVQPEKSEGYMAGGNSILDAAGNVVHSANLTLDPDTGIGKWSEQEFVRALRTGVRPDGRALRYPMMTYPELSDDEARATFAYLKTVPVQHHPVERNFDAFPWQAPNASAGEQLYNKYACFSCHGNQGVGVCDLRHASQKYENDEKLSQFLHDASKFVPGTKMPTWSGVIAEADYPVLIAYVHQLEHAAASATR